MKLDRRYLSENNSYEGQIPQYIVIHNTDNYNIDADAKAHARAQYNGNFNGMSAHVYVDDREAYQTLDFDRGAWHVGSDYGGRLFGIVNNKNSVGIEMCIQKGYNYEKAFSNTVVICCQLMVQLGIPADRVVQHYDVCAKNCPSEIRAKGDWDRFKKAVGGDFSEKSPYQVQRISLTEKVEVSFPEISKGYTGVAVRMLQIVLKVEADGIFGEKTEKALRAFQKKNSLVQDGICGKNSWTSVMDTMKANTFACD